MTNDPGNGRLGVIVLAAGQGMRMRSHIAKVLHPVAGRPMISRVLDTAQAVGARERALVLGHLADQVRAVVPPDVLCVVQEPQLGTGHAVQTAAPLLRQRGLDRVLVLYGDMPLIRPSSLERLLALPLGPRQPVALLSAVVRDPFGYGRVLRDAQGAVRALVEEADATPEERAVNEMHSGVMVVWADWLWPALERLPLRPKGEYYLTDLVNLANVAGLMVQAVAAEDEDEVQGANDRAQLARANEIVWQRTRAAIMAGGVTLVDPASTWVEPEAEIAADVVLQPGTYVRGHSRIESGAEIGPHTMIVDGQVGAGARVRQSLVDQGAVVGAGADVGPFAHVRGPAQYVV